MENETEFIQTSRGGESLVVDRKFKFRFHKHQGEKRYWKCVTENCKARAHTDAANRLVHLTDHNHEPMAAKIAADQIVRGVKRRASEELTPIPRISQEEVTAAQQAGVADEVAAFLPNFQGYSSSAYRRRFAILPERREDIVLEGEWSQTADQQNFVIANEGEAEKLIIFGSVEGLLQICRANTVYMDETFFAVPTLFAQLYTVHGKVYGQMFPLLYGLLPNKTEETYGRFVNSIQADAVENDVQFDPDTIMVDFEVASIQAYRQALPRTTIKGCLFLLWAMYSERSSACGSCRSIPSS